MPYVGLIPARAGNTVSTARRKACVRAHPRSRGEHSTALTVSLESQGSSPLARGTQAQALQPSIPAGLIPARAGNTHAL